MKIKNILSMIVISIIAISFTACGDGSDASFSNSEEKIVIKDCNTTGAVIPTDFTTMQSADTIIKKETTTTITTYHDISGNKKVCVDMGSAYLLRK